MQDFDHPSTSEAATIGLLDSALAMLPHVHEARQRASASKGMTRATGTSVPLQHGVRQPKHAILLLTCSPRIVSPHRVHCPPHQLHFCYLVI